MLKKKKSSFKNLEQLASLAELIVEDYRFRRSYLLIIDKLFAEEKSKYESTYAFHTNKVSEITKELRLNVKSYDGWDFDEGLPITPLNADEFGSIENLYVQQTIEPTILTDEGNIVKQGTVILACKQDIKN